MTELLLNAVFYSALVVLSFLALINLSALTYGTCLKLRSLYHEWTRKRWTRKFVVSSWVKRRHMFYDDWGQQNGLKRRTYFGVWKESNHGFSIRIKRKIINELKSS